MLALYPNEFGVKRKRPKSSYRRRLISRLSESQNHRCCHCGGELILRDEYKVDESNQLHKHYATIEHIIPHRYGGDWSYENLAAAHFCCNKYFTDSSSIGFFKYRRMLKQKMGINLKLHPENYGLQPNKLVYNAL